MRIFSLCRLISLISIGIVLLVGCTSKDEVTLVKSKDLATTERMWTEPLEKGVYLKKTDDNEGVLYVNLRSNKQKYHTIDVQVLKNGDTYKIDIKEKDALQDSEVTSEYLGNLKSELPMKDLEVYLNDEKVELIIIE